MRARRRAQPNALIAIAISASLCIAAAHTVAEPELANGKCEAEGAEVIAAATNGHVANDRCTLKSAKPFEDIELVPPDVTLYLQIEDAAELRQEIGDWPIGEWIGSLMAGDELAKVWADLCQQLEVDERELFDVVFGSRCTLLVRANAGSVAGDAREWAVILHIDQNQSRSLVRKMRLVPAWPVAGINLGQVPEQRMLIGRAGNRMIVGPSDHPDLMRDVLRRISEPNAHQSLASTGMLNRAGRLGVGQISVWAANPAPAGGYSLISARLRHGHVRVRHYGRFEQTPFSRPISNERIDVSAVRSIEDRTLAVVVEPTDIGDTMIERFLSQMFGVGLLSSEMREHVGSRRLIVIGEEEGRLRDDPADILAPTLAIAYECRTAGATRRQAKDKDADPAAAMTPLEWNQNLLAKLDRHVPQIATGLSRRLGNGKAEGQLHEQWDSAKVRRIDLSDDLHQFSDGMPLLNTLILSWDLVEGPASQPWIALATHPDHLEDVKHALSRTQQRAGIGQVENAGSVHGQRFAQHLRSWSERADDLAIPGREAQFRESMMMISGLMASMDRARWCTRRPCDSSVWIDLDIELAPPRSAGGR